MGAVEVVGRDAEISLVYGFLDRAAYGPRALVLEGEPGIGKSTLWLAGVEHARSLGCRVLSARPAEAEHGLAHVGLGDLFEDVLEDVLVRLSAPRRRALERALLLVDETPDAVDARALGIARWFGTFSKCSRSSDRRWSPSTICNGSTQPRLARWPSRCEG